MPDGDETIVNNDDDDEMADFVVPDDYSDDDEPPVSSSRKTKSSRSVSPTKATPNKKRTESTNNSALEKFSSLSSYKPALTPSKANGASSPMKKSTATPNKQATFEKMNEERYQWLVNIKDADGNPEGSPDYDPRTLYIPKSAWSKFTPFEKQYWEVKSTMWNTVVFFKKGKFYELYENDADIAHSTFDLKLAGGGRANMRLAGVPEMSFDYWASAFIAKGYKVARVDQKETALAKEMRESAGTGPSKKEEKVIRRELSFVLTGGTLVDEAMLVDDMSTYCMAIKQDETKFAVCFVDTATGTFYSTQFEDDIDYSHFETLVAQTRPRELVLEKGIISMRAVKILKNNTSVGTLWNYLKPGAEFWDAETSMEQIVRAKYFEAEDLDDLSKYPKILRELCESESKALSLSAFGALAWYLRSLKVDRNIISLGNFNEYEAMRKEKGSMILDGQSLQNLEVFANTFDGGSRGTLFELLNRCITPFGKRQLQVWVCHPLMDAQKINSRLDAVEQLMRDGELREFLERKLAILPDLERLLSRVHSGRLPPKDFARVIDGFQVIDTLKAGVVANYMEGDGETDTSLIGQLISSMPAIEEHLREWASAVDWEEAKANNNLVPETGIEPEYDECMEVIREIEGRLEKQLREYRREYRSQEICYRDSGKEIYLIEMPSKIKNIPKSWQQMAATSKVKRYWSPEVRGLARELMEAKETLRSVSEAVQLRLYARFDEKYQAWLGAVKVVASIDCLLSLAKTSMGLGVPSTRPEIIEENENKNEKEGQGDGQRSFLEFKELRHPCFDESKKVFVPNDIELGGSQSNLVLLTGANAAGKSTVLRMTCVAVMMAQMGCYVPASSARLTPIDRIMTRLGANDNIFAGKSTFYVELAETKRMLTEATPRTLLVLDELGRGGSSSDGFAIAEAVLHHLATHVGSLGFFATHYNTLWGSFRGHPEVATKQMEILVDEGSRKVSFLYRLVDGVSPGSFGMHVAAMCGIDGGIVDRAEEAAKRYEHTSRMKRLMALTQAQTKVEKKSEEQGEEIKNTDDDDDDSSTSGMGVVPLGAQSDLKWAMKCLENGKEIEEREDLKLSRLGGADEEEQRRVHALVSLLNMVKSQLQ